ncbi:hypothetical protein KFK09_026646 [Dendrobium nobile]|uniref:Reverse transcriptase zinc-binding domain-containing protein n=1 Tax=Dendrobium nobile TaxID=94219 RepID=A0A8T3ADI0_DENNO|nr:hypothetical protein KFK09_026646 [Dendrobium nobile]
MQFSFNCSVILRLYNVPSPLSAWVFRKYRSPWKPPPYAASSFWKSICNTANVAKHCFKFGIVNSAPISLKWDHWIGDNNLCDLFGIEYLALIPDIAISNIISDSVWVLPDSFSTSLTDVISGITGIEGEGPCLLCWYNMVWHKRKALKFSVFAWMANKGGLKTADALRLRHIFVPSICRLCHISDESVSHLFFECNYSFSILSGGEPRCPVRHFDCVTDEGTTAGGCPIQRLDPAVLFNGLRDSPSDPYSTDYRTKDALFNGSDICSTLDCLYCSSAQTQLNRSA